MVYSQTGQYDKAEPLYLRSLAIREEKLGKDHPDVAISLNNLAGLYKSQGQHAKAEPLYLGGLAIWEAKLGKEHPSVATSLNNLAELYRTMGKYAQAEPLFRRSLAIKEAKLGKDHPDIATTLNNLALLAEAGGRVTEAADRTDQARRLIRRHVALVLPALSPSEQDNFLRHNDVKAWHRALSLGLRHADSPALAARSACWLLNGKAVAHQAAAQAALLARDGSDPELGPLSRRLADLRQRLARLTLATPAPGQEQARQAELAQLQGQEAELAKRLHQAGDYSLRPDLWGELDKIRQGLPADAVFIDVARVDMFDFKEPDPKKHWQPARYAAWITTAEWPVRVVDLGPAAAIDAAVRDVRQALQGASGDIRRQGEPEAESTLRLRLEKLAGLVLRPLLPHAGSRPRWILSPDAGPWLVPWAALPLPDGKYAVEEYTLSYVVNGRDLVNATVQPKVQPTSPLVLADPDFDLGLTQVARATRALLRGQQPLEETRGLSDALKLGSIPRLPGTAAEAEAIAPRLQQYSGAEPRLYTDRQALTGVFQAARNPKVVLLSTHGFFLPDQVVEPKERERQGAEASKPVKGLENPLLRCGLLLAGCNHADQAQEGEDTGVLTGLQIVGTDLRGTELVVLSACETGLGEVRNGEGVAGLRQAFQLAGAESVVATLWQVPDQQSAQLMIRFFDNLAAKQSKDVALRNAQLALIKARRDKNAAAHPFFWAAFTLTGM